MPRSRDGRGRVARSPRRGADLRGFARRHWRSALGVRQRQGAAGTRFWRRRAVRGSGRSGGSGSGTRARRVDRLPRRGCGSTRVMVAAGWSVACARRAVHPACPCTNVHLIPRDRGEGGRRDPGGPLGRPSPLAPAGWPQAQRRQPRHGGAPARGRESTTPTPAPLPRAEVPLSGGCRDVLSGPGTPAGRPPHDMVEHAWEGGGGAGSRGGRGVPVDDDCLHVSGFHGNELDEQ